MRFQLLRQGGPARTGRPPYVHLQRSDYVRPGARSLPHDCGYVRRNTQCGPFACGATVRTRLAGRGGRERVDSRRRPAGSSGPRARHRWRRCSRWPTSLRSSKRCFVSRPVRNTSDTCAATSSASKPNRRFPHFQIQLFFRPRGAPAARMILPHLSTHASTHTPYAWMTMRVPKLLLCSQSCSERWSL